MKMKTLSDRLEIQDPVIALFGRAKLVKKSRSRFELIGGEPSDVTEAKEWISLFLHEAILINPE
jgi:hypothetical protein